jgi:hypothetical protein
MVYHVVFVFNDSPDVFINPVEITVVYMTVVLIAVVMKGIVIEASIVVVIIPAIVIVRGISVTTIGKVLLYSCSNVAIVTSIWN